MKNKKGTYIRLGTVPLNYVLDFVPISTGLSKKGLPKIPKVEKEYFGKIVSLASHRYRLFKEKGVKCVHCDLEGKFFALEKQSKLGKYDNGDKWHFNLYGYNENGDEVMLTKDHMKPRSKGWKNNLDNYQTLCQNCNSKKSDWYEEGQVN
jgi:hypothetical protein